jgi:hypothetical protein
MLGLCLTKGCVCPGLLLKSLDYVGKFVGFLLSQFDDAIPDVVKLFRSSLFLVWGSNWAFAYFSELLRIFLIAFFWSIRWWAMETWLEAIGSTCWVVPIFMLFATWWWGTVYYWWVHFYLDGILAECNWFTNFHFSEFPLRLSTYGPPTYSI